MSALEKVTHVIFDMDGLLLDTETLYTEVFQKILDPYGKTYTWEVKQTLMGCQSIEAAKNMVKIYDLPITWEEFADQSTALTSQIMADAQLLPDTENIYKSIVRDIAKAHNKPYPYD